MEHQSLIPSPNDDGKKQKKGSPPLLVIVSTALLLLGLVFYGGEYWGSHHRALGDGPTSGDLIPFGDPCTSSDDCAIPPGLKHGNCASKHRKGPFICQSGQQDALCDQTSDCVVPPGLEHGVCRDYSCQMGKSGALCGQTSDCVVQTGLTPPHAVCRNGKCQQ